MHTRYDFLRAPSQDSRMLGYTLVGNIPAKIVETFVMRLLTMQVLSSCVPTNYGQDCNRLGAIENMTLTLGYQLDTSLTITSLS